MNLVVDRTAYLLHLAAAAYWLPQSNFVAVSHGMVQVSVDCKLCHVLGIADPKSWLQQLFKQVICYLLSLLGVCSLAVWPASLLHYPGHSRGMPTQSCTLWRFENYCRLCMISSTDKQLAMANWARFVGLMLGRDPQRMAEASNSNESLSSVGSGGPWMYAYSRALKRGQACNTSFCRSFLHLQRSQDLGPYDYVRLCQMLQRGLELILCSYTVWSSVPYWEGLRLGKSFSVPSIWLVARFIIWWIWQAARNSLQLFCLTQLTTRQTHLRAHHPQTHAKLYASLAKL